MADRHDTPVKLTRPAGNGLVRRERLFRRLDAALAHRLVWIAGPGGAGKTSLVATFIEARGLDAVWYQLDAGDADPSTVFYFLRRAVPAAVAPESLPAFTLADGDDLDGFARRFFRDFVAALRRPVVVVFDNYQEVPADSPVHGVLAQLLDCAPAGVCTMVVSRSPPPGPLARFVASADFESLSWADLRFTPEESAALAAASGLTDPDKVGAVHDLSRGWAVGLRLLVRADADGASLARPGSDPTALFDYFAHAIFDRIPPASRGFLLRTAFLPYVTPALAGQLTGHSGAAGVLASLHRENLFTEHKASDEPVYEYHPLFRDFLRARARAVLDPAELEFLGRCAAGELEKLGQLDASAALLADAGVWHDLERFIDRHAEAMIGVSRVPTLRNWISSLPRALAESRPWMVFWLGYCEMALREPAYRATFQRAYDLFAQAGDVRGTFAAAAWLLRMSTTLHESELWLERVEALGRQHVEWPAPELEAQVIGHFRMLVQQFPPGHWLVERWTARARTLAGSLADPRLRLAMAGYVLMQHFIRGDVETLRESVAAFRPLLDLPGVSPIDQAEFLILESLVGAADGDLAAMEASLARVESITTANCLVQFRIAAAIFGLRVAFLRHDLARARRYLARLDALVAYSPQHAGRRFGPAAHLLLREGDTDGALAAVRAAVDTADLYPVNRPYWLTVLGEVHVARGEHALAVAALGAAIELARAYESRSMEYAAELLSAHAQHESGNEPAGREALARALALGERLGTVPAQPWVLPEVLSALVARAFRDGIGVAHARSLVRKLRLAPPGADTNAWPWPIRVYTFGRFTVKRDDGLDRAGAPRSVRPQRKPLELLKAVIALGERSVNAATVCALLWPDAEGDAAKRSFDITLHRLRRLLGSDDSIALEGGKLALDEAIVWTDHRRFDRVCGRLEARLGAGDESVDAPIAELLRLYRGHFLDDDDGLAWLQPYRERLRSRFVRVVEAAGRLREARGEAPEAEGLYRRALEIDPLAEELWFLLMRCLADQGARGHALETYRRCRDTLVRSLGVRPAPRIEALYQELKAG